MRIEKLLDALRSVMSKDRCIELSYLPRKKEVVARIDLDEGINDGELLAIYGIMKDMGFSGFWINSGECDILEDKYTAPEIDFHAREEDVDPSLVKFLRERGGRFTICKLGKG